MSPIQMAKLVYAVVVMTIVAIVMLVRWALGY